MPRNGFWLLAPVLLTVLSDFASGQTARPTAPSARSQRSAQVQITGAKKKKNDWAYYEKEGAAEATISDARPVAGPRPKQAPALREVDAPPLLYRVQTPGKSEPETSPEPAKLPTDPPAESKDGWKSAEKLDDKADDEANAPKDAATPKPRSARDPRIVRRLRPTESASSPSSKPEARLEPVKPQPAKPEATPLAKPEQSKPTPGTPAPSVPSQPLPELEPIPPLDPQMIQLRDQMRATLSYYYQNRRLNTREHNHWEIMHSIVAWGVETEIERNGRGGEPVNAISYECWNQPCRGETMLYRSGSTIRARKGPRMQGHYGQFLKMLALAGVSPEYPMQVDGVRYRVADLIESEKQTCYSGTELTFKLIALSYYLDDMDQTWQNTRGETWDIQRLIREELQKPILRNAACGGTHRLMGFSYAIRQRQRRGLPMTGEYVRAEQFINEYIRYTFGLQNNDGSFSTEWFRSREASGDIDRRLQTTGHILEWLTYTVPDELVTHPRMVMAVRYLTNLMATYRTKQWEIGPQGHALHALVLYDRRVFRAHEMRVREREELIRQRESQKSQQPPVAEPEFTEPETLKEPEPKSTEPKGAEPKSAEPKSTEPITEPQPVEPDQEPELTEPKGEPTPVEPKKTGEPTPAEPRGEEPTPAEPTPAEPKEEPKLAEPTPAKPKSAQPTPAEPKSEQPEPANPQGEPTPAEPLTQEADEPGKPTTDAEPKSADGWKPAKPREKSKPTQPEPAADAKSEPQPEEAEAKEAPPATDAAAAQPQDSSDGEAKAPKTPGDQSDADQPATDKSTDQPAQNAKQPAVSQKPAGPTLIAPSNARR